MKVPLKRRDEVGPSLISGGDYIAQVKTENWGVFKCPKCAGVTSLSRKIHNVYYDGTVTPKVKCPHVTCDFSADIILEGWIPEAKGNA